MYVEVAICQFRFVIFHLTIRPACLSGVGELLGTGELHKVCLSIMKLILDILKPSDMK